MSKMKSIPSSKPRNPLVAVARFLRAGRHEREAGAVRQSERRFLIRELAGFELTPYDEPDKPPKP